MYISLHLLSGHNLYSKHTSAAPTTVHLYQSVSQPVCNITFDLNEGIEVIICCHGVYHFRPHYMICEFVLDKEKSVM